jgi:hypothetical protein
MILCFSKMTRKGCSFTYFVRDKKGKKCVKEVDKNHVSSSIWKSKIALVVVWDDDDNNNKEIAMDRNWTNASLKV